ncbi:MAG: hypothetical protein ABIP81_02515 [Terriglobales bacterium]
MKKFSIFGAALMLAATASVAQSAPAKTQSPPAQSKPAPPTLEPITPATAQPPTGLEPSKVAKAPEAKTPEEFKAYQDAIAVPDAAAAEVAADAFAKQYPASELRVPAYSMLLQKAYEANETSKILSLGRKVLAIEPDNAMTQVVTATAMAETTKTTDLDYAEKFSEANKLIDGALKNIDTMLPQPNVTPEQFELLKNMLRSMAHSAKGYMAMNKRDYLGSEDAFQKAVNANPAQPDPVLYLRLAVAQDNQRKWAPALSNATKALQLAEAQNNPVVANLARGERDRVQKLMGSPTATKPAATTPPKK